MPWKTTPLSEFSDNPFSLVGDEWMLVAARDGTRQNMMTASWGGLGVLWNRPVATVYIRPQRYTHEFVEAADSFTLSFFDRTFRHALNLCGTRSGRDVDKASAAGLTCEEGPHDTVLFAEARCALVCRKLYRGRLAEEEFLDPTIPPANYPEKDYHTVFIGEITEYLTKTV